MDLSAPHLSLQSLRENRPRGLPFQVLHDQVVDAVLLSNVIEGLDIMGQRCPLRAHETSGLRESGNLTSSICRSREAGSD